jgi:8-oxo-dGTP diphosphatase
LYKSRLTAQQLNDEPWKKKIVTPRVGVAGVVESPDRNMILVIRRKWPPKGLAFPGGFVELGETITETAIREVKEETGIDAEVVGILNICSKPEFDPRMHIVAPHLIMRAKEFGEPKGMDDALDTFWMDYKSDEMCFEFNSVALLTLYDYRDWRKDPSKIKLR